MSRASDIKDALSEVCPIDSITIIDDAARSVVIGYAKTATAQQRAAADAKLAAFDWSAPSGEEKFAAKVAQAKQTIKNNWSTMTPVEKALAILLQAD